MVMVFQSSSYSCNYIRGERFFMSKCVKCIQCLVVVYGYYLLLSSAHNLSPSLLLPAAHTVSDMGMWLMSANQNPLPQIWSLREELSLGLQWSVQWWTHDPGRPMSLGSGKRSAKLVWWCLGCWEGRVSWGEREEETDLWETLVGLWDSGTGMGRQPIKGVTTMGNW